jgi:hypothetical protein
MRSLPFLIEIRELRVISTLLLAGRRVRPDEESPGLAPGSTIRIRSGAAMGRTFGARYHWQANRWGWYSRWRSNDDEVEQDMAEGNIVRNPSENHTHVVSTINGGYVLTNDGWWITTDDVIV